MVAQISFCIVTYNSSRTIVETLDSIALYCKVPYEIVVVDNCSTDGTLDILRAYKSSFLKVLVSDNNSGFGSGNNVAFRNINSPVIALLNSDAFLMSPITSDHVSLVTVNEEIGALGGVMLSRSLSSRSVFGKFPKGKDLISLKSTMGKINEILEFSGRRFLSVDWFEASFMIMRADVFRSFDGFDERFFMYCEDLDLCYRLKQLNKRILIDLDTFYIHLGGYSVTRKSWLNSSYLKFVLKNYSGSAKYFSVFFLSVRLFFGR